MSSLPPLPPEVQAHLNQHFPKVVDTLDTFVTALRSDPKRDPSNLPDYHNTVVTMLLQVEKQDPEGGADTNRRLAALAFIQLADSGWTPPDPNENMPDLDDPATTGRPRPRRRGRLKRRRR